MMSSNITFESGDETATVLTFETKFGKTKWLARKANSFLSLYYLLCRVELPLSKVEANLTLRPRVGCTSFSISVFVLE